MSKKHDELERVREAICEVFGTYLSIEFDDDHNLLPPDMEKVRKAVEGSTYTGEDDPGGWSPNAVAIIHCEDEIPNGSYDDSGRILDMWFKVSELLGDLYCEHINAAVIGVYPS